MLEVTQEIIEQIDPMLDAGETETAGRLLWGVDKISLRAVLIHIMRRRGPAVAEAVGAAYLSRHCPA